MPEEGTGAGQGATTGAMKGDEPGRLPMTAQTILVVEDNPITRTMLRSALSAEGYAVLEAPDGRTALGLVSKAPPDLVLQDLVLPDMDGFDLVGQLRALVPGAVMPIIAFSGFLSRLETARVLTVGFADFLVKPVERSSLLRTVRTYLPVTGAADGDLGKGRHVLLVDDDPMQLRLGQVHLQDRGFRVTTAPDGAAALEQARQEPPDAILSDVLMPRLDGFQLCLAVRHDPTLAAVPVVLCSTSYLNDADRRLAERIGASALVVGSPDFRDAIAALVTSLGTPPSAPEGPVEPLETERLLRVAQQLEGQMVTNVGLVQRLSLQASALAILARLSGAIAHPFDVELAPAELLAHILDAGGISSGALYLAGADRRLRFHAQSGYPDGAVREAEGFFGHPELFDRCVEIGQPIMVPSPGVPEESARGFLGRVGTASAVLAPLVARDERIGVLLMAVHRRNLTQEDWLAFTQTIAGQIAQVIALSRAFSRLTASELRYRRLFENVPLGLYRGTPEGRLLDVNDVCLELLGYPSRGALLAANAADLYVDPADRRAWVGRLVSERVVRGYEVQLRRHDGTRIWARTSARILDTGEDGLVYEGSLEDITERRRTEEALRESEERFRRAFEDSAVGMALQATDGHYLRVNQALCQMLGYSEQELLSVSFETIVHPDDRSADLQHDRRMLSGETRWYQAEKRYLHKAGYPVWALVNVSLVHDRHGRPAYFIAQAQDLTQRKRAEEELQRQRETFGQAEKLAAMGQLLAGVAHELNNPLAIVLGQAALLGAKLGAGPLAERAGKIGQAAERCARIVRNFLALARQRPVERQEVRLNQVVREAVELLAYHLRLDNVEVCLDLAPDLPVLLADPHQLGQVLVNLIMNAHYVLREVSGPRRLILVTRSDAARRLITLEVADTGPGILAAVQGRLFEPFFTTKPPGQGTGLGLSLCRGIVEAHHGTIRAESRPDHGAVFRVELPFAAPGPPRLAPGPVALRSLPAKSILVVDDEAGVAEVLAEMLEADGHRVERAHNGVQALERLGTRAYDVILTDLKMPELDGLGLYREMERRYPALLGRLVFLTGDALSPQITEFLDRAGRPRLSKPFTPDEVRRVIAQALEAPAAATLGAIG